LFGIGDCLKRVEKGCIIMVEVIPNSTTTRIIEADRWRKRLRISVAARPRQGEANRELVWYMSTVLGRDVELERGARGRNKTLLVFGCTPEEIEAKLRRVLEHEGKGKT